MILVQNLLQPLNGSKKSLFFLFLGLLCSCAARKNNTVSSTQNVQPTRPGYTTGSLKKDSGILSSKRQDPESFSTISLLLPFKLSAINVENRAELEKSYLPLDFYQGFRLAIDSLAATGSKIRLNVLDSQDDSSRISSLIALGQLDHSSLVVGPIFPGEIEKVKSFAARNHTFFVSPLSPHKLSEFNNPYLIQVSSPLEAYARQTAIFINEHYPGAHIVILRFTESDEKFIKPLTEVLVAAPEIIKAINNQKMVFLKSKLEPGKQHILIVPSLDKSFWSNLMLYLTGQNLDIPLVIFGHPNFERLQFTNYDLMQQIGLRFASNYLLDRSEQNVQGFIRAYKNRYFANPSRYAVIGFDIGTYFGRLAKNKSTIEEALKESDFKGLHTEFKFKKVPGQGYENNSIMILKYNQGQLLEDK